jgi:hypothetical protein
MFEKDKQTKLEETNLAFEKEKEANEFTENNENVVTVPPPPERPPLYKRAFFFICGIETLRNQKKDEVEPEPNVSIDTDPFWSKVIDFVALFVAAVAGFFIAFFNKY